MLRPLLIVLSYAVVFGAGRAQVSPSEQAAAADSEATTQAPCLPEVTTLAAQLVTYGDSVVFDLTESARSNTAVETATGSWSSLRVDRKSRRYAAALEVAGFGQARLGDYALGLVEVCVTISPVAGDLERLDLVTPSGKTVQLLKGKMRKPRIGRQVCFSPLVEHSFANVSWIEDWDAKPIAWAKLAGESIDGAWQIVGVADYGTAAAIQLSGWTIAFATSNEDSVRPARDSLLALGGNRFSARPEASGAYRFDVVTDGGCVRSYVFPVNVQSNCGFNVRLADNREPSCPGAADGSLSFVAVGAEGAPTYTLSGTTNTSGYFGDLSAGSYMLRVRGADGCLLEKTYGLTEAPSAALQIEQIAATCAPARYDVSVVDVGAVPTASATWSGSGDQALDRLSMLDPGTHVLNYVDERGCAYADTLELAPAGDLVVEVLAKAPACATDGNGAIELTASNGLAPYDAIWDDLSSGLRREYLYPGTYGGIVYDSRGCEARFTATIKAPTPLLVRHELLPPRCPGDRNGILSVSASGGSEPYVLSIDGGAFRGAFSIDTLSSGLHSFTVRDGGGCEISQVVDVPIRTLLPAEFDSSSLGSASVVEHRGEARVELETSIAERSATRWRERLQTGTVPPCDTCAAEAIAAINQELDRLIASSADCPSEPGGGGDGEPLPRVRVPEVFKSGSTKFGSNVLRVFGRSGTVIDRFAVYDLAGVLVFEASGFEVDTPRGWDGRYKGAYAPAGAYLYEVRATLPSGATDRARGTITLVR